MARINYPQEVKDSLNKDIKKHFHHIFPIEPWMKNTRSGVSRMVMLERYAQKDVTLMTLRPGDFVVVTIKDDIKFPTLGTGYVQAVSPRKKITVCVDQQYRLQIDPEYTQKQPGHITLASHFVSKPLELFYEQIAKRVGHAVAVDEHPKWADVFTKEITAGNIVPAGRILYGAGSKSQVTFFNCYVLPMIHDSKNGIAKHRKELAEIMAYGGGVGSNGSTLRPRNAYVKGTNGKSSGSVSWLNDLSTLTDLIQQGGSRRGAQMIMLQVWHPDVIEFIVSKMQKANILKWIADNFSDSIVRQEARRKLRFIPLSPLKKQAYRSLVNAKNLPDNPEIKKAQQLLKAGGEYEVVSPQFLSGANISVGITDDFMAAVDADQEWQLRFPDFIRMTSQQKDFYNQNWQNIADVREWGKLGYPVRVYHTIRARELWDLINFCATYSAEPGVFFIDVANRMTNAVAYNQKVVCTNPCGEQPLTPYAVCNLSAINLANFVDKQKSVVLWQKLKNTVAVCTRFQDNVIDVTPYFMEANKLQATKERRLGMGVMGLHDMLIWLGIRYGSKEGNKVISKVFETIATTAYLTSSKLAKEKGSFAFLLDSKKLLNSGYLRKMPASVRNAIARDGLRNSHLLTIAPTGTTGTMMGVSTGLEPYFAFKHFRTGRLGKFIEVDQEIVQEWRKVNNYKEKELPTFFNSAMDLTPEEHVDVQTTIQRWVDSSISKTVNAPQGYTVRQVERIYRRLYKNGAKGGTVYVDGSRNAQVLTLSREKSSVQEAVPVLTTRGSQESIVRIQSRHADVPGIVANRKIGVDVGNLCPICRTGVIERIGGCNSCTNCRTQLKCGL